MAGILVTIGVVETRNAEGHKTGVFDVCRDFETGEVVVRVNRMGEEVIMRMTNDETRMLRAVFSEAAL
jgi:hypothetical protein